MHEWYSQLQDKLNEILNEDYDDAAHPRNAKFRPVSTVSSTFLMGKDHESVFAVDINTAFVWRFASFQAMQKGLIQGSPDLTNSPSAYDSFKKNRVLPRFATLGCVNATIENKIFKVDEVLIAASEHDYGMDDDDDAE